MLALIVVNSISIGIQGGTYVCTLALSSENNVTLYAKLKYETYLPVFFMYCLLELPLSNNTGVVVVKHILDFIDAFTVIVFSAEIVLKWIDNFFTFWKDYWNVFDLIVTILVGGRHT